MSHEIRKSQHERPQAEPQVSCAPAANASGSDTSPGAPPSNTAPANYIDGPTRIFRTGIDSLYLSWSGTLSLDIDQLLTSLKEKAQSPDPKEQAKAVLQLLDHRFEVSDKGRGRFPFVLRDNWYQIQISRTHSTAMPLATAQISSELLSKSGYSQSVRKLELLISELGDIEYKKISRIDICADFYTEFNLGLIHPNAWVMQAVDFDLHYPGHKFSGLSFGKGGAISGRLYDKTLEIKRSNKTFFYPLWAEGGWLGELPVWRLEFQFRREVLKEMGVDSTLNLDEKLNGLWQYACQKWLRLTIPSNTDTAKSRWPDHPLWIALKKARFGEGDLMPLYRVRKERLPSQEFLYVNGLGAFTSYMAANGISSLEKAVKSYLRDANEYHRTRRASGNSLGTYVNAKCLQKARKFNSRLKADYKDKDPEAYRKAKEGE